MPKKTLKNLNASFIIYSLKFVVDQIIIDRNVIKNN